MNNLFHEKQTLVQKYKKEYCTLVNVEEMIV